MALIHPQTVTVSGCVNQEQKDLFQNPRIWDVRMTGRETGSDVFIQIKHIIKERLQPVATRKGSRGSGLHLEVGGQELGQQRRSPCEGVQT